MSDKREPQFFIVLRNPSNGRLVPIDTGEGRPLNLLDIIRANYAIKEDPPIMTWPSAGHAIKASESIPICQAWPFDIYEAP